MLSSSCPFRTLMRSVSTLRVAVLLTCLATALPDSFISADLYGTNDVTTDDLAFRFVQNTADDPCGRTTPLAVVIVCSAVENFSRRDVIRQTWATADPRQLRVVFLLGLTETGSSGAVADEARRHGDVIQADFVDTYANLSLKSLAALSWTRQHAACARFVVKVDDDTFINTRLLARDLGACAHNRFVMGHVIARAQPVRRPGEKWYTPVSVYPRPSYPTYASGAAYVISGDAVGPLLEAARVGAIEFFWIEDVYITGMLARAAGLQLIENGKFDGYRTFADACAVRNHIVRHRLSEEEVRTLWTTLTQAKCVDRIRR